MIEMMECSDSLILDFHEMISTIEQKLPIPPIKQFFFPEIHPKHQPKSAEFMAIRLEDDSIGLGYVLNEIIKDSDFSDFKIENIVGMNPIKIAKKFGSKNGVEQIVSVACINAICQYAFKKVNYKLDKTIDSLGLLNVNKDDIVGMVGLFRPLVGLVKKAGAKLIIIEKRPELIEELPKLEIKLEPSVLVKCNKILCTTTTILNNTIDQVLSYCTNAEIISIIGPTAGFFPDPLFKRGVKVLGGSFVKSPDEFFNRISAGEFWWDTTEKYCIEKSKYAGLHEILKNS